MGLTKEDLARLKADRDVITGEKTGELYYESEASFPYEEPTTIAAGGENVLRMLGNIPGDIANVGKGLYEVASDIPGTAEIFARGIMGAGEIAGNVSGLPFLRGAETQNADIARQMGGSIAERIMNPGRTLVEEPVQSAMDISGLGPAARLLGAGKAATAARAASPIDLTRRAVGGTARGAGRGAEATARQGSGFLTGFPPEAFEAMSNAGRMLDKTSRGKVKKALREKRFLEHIGNDVIEGLQKIKKDMGEAYTERLARIDWKNKDDPISLEGFQIQTEAMLKNENITSIRDDIGTITGLEPTSRSTISPQFTGHLRSIQRVMKEVEDWTDDSPHGFDILKKRIQGHRDRIPPNNKEPRRIIGAIQNNLREKLGKKVEGYDEMTSGYERTKTQLDEFDAIFRSGAESRETFLNKLTDLVKEPANYDLRRRVMGDLMAATESPIAEEVAGAILSQWAPKGLIGRSAAAGAAGGAYLGLTTIVKMMVFLPMTSPRLMGEFFLNLVGGGKRHGDTVSRIMGKIHSAVPDGMITEGMTVGEVVQSLMEEKEEPVNPLRAFGGR